MTSVNSVMSMLAPHILAELLPQTPTFLDDLTPQSGLALRRWTTDEYHRMAYPAVFGPEERLELLSGEVLVRGEGFPRLWTRDEYYRLAECGILRPDERTELIYGRVVTRMSPMNAPHAMAVRRAGIALEQAFGSGHDVRPQMPMRLSTGLEPEPDVLVVPGTPLDYPDHPLAAVALLVVEVSDTTLRFDRHSKSVMYAVEGIPEYWLLNINARTLEVRRQPENSEYQSLDALHDGETVTLLSASASVAVADLLPRR